MASKMITPVEWDLIKGEYAFIRNVSDFEMPAECREHDDWQRVYKQGCDSKYGTIMVPHSMRDLAPPDVQRVLRRGCYRLEETSSNGLASSPRKQAFSG